MSNFLSVTDLTKQEFNAIIDNAIELKKSYAKHRDVFKGKTLLMYFEKPSTRTRLSFESGFAKLGGHPIFFTGGHISSGKEDLRDTAEMYSRFTDLVVARVYSHEALVELARHSKIPIINGLSDLEHPCQALADLMTVKEHRGFENTTLAYIGDGNNVANSLALACAYTGVKFKIATPKGYEMSKDIAAKAKALGGNIEAFNDAKQAVQGADFVYTDVWVSMGDEKEERQRLSAFKDYQVNGELMKIASLGAKFMHCLPAIKGKEVTAEVFSSPQSIVYDQAENRMHAQNALMMHLLEKH